MEQHAVLGRRLLRCCGAREGHDWNGPRASWDDEQVGGACNTIDRKTSCTHLSLHARYQLASHHVISIRTGRLLSDLNCRYESLGDSDKRRLEHDEDRLLFVMLHNTIAIMVLMGVKVTDIKRRVRRLLGKCHIGLAWSHEVNALFDQIQILVRVCVNCVAYWHVLTRPISFFYILCFISTGWLTLLLLSDWLMRVGVCRKAMTLTYCRPTAEWCRNIHLRSTGDQPTLATCSLWRYYLAIGWLNKHGLTNTFLWWGVTW